MVEEVCSVFQWKIDCRALDEPVDLLVADLTPMRRMERLSNDMTYVDNVTDVRKLARLPLQTLIKLKN